MAEPIVISGTDPTNPRRAADIITRLEQIERDTRAMHMEAGRLSSFSEFIRDVLRDQQGVPDRRAAECARVAREQIRKLWTMLDECSSQAHAAVQAIHESRVNVHASFEWRPTHGR